MLTRLPQTKPDLAAFIRTNLISPKNGEIIGPYGPIPYVYGDWTASGQSLRCIEEFIEQEVLPCYANTHTEASFSGQQMGVYRENARAMIKKACNADESDVCLFTGSGATAAIQKLVDMLEIRLAPGPESKMRRDALPAHERPVVLLGPWEHHSNMLIWRETTARIIDIPAEPQTGGFSYSALISTLEAVQASSQPRHPLLIGSFSAASNVTGTTLDMRKVAWIMHRYGGLAFFDCAAWGSHLAVDMNPMGGERGGESPDAVFLSPHKLAGGPGCPGVLLAKKRIVKNLTPSSVGGGVVEHVSRTAAVWVSDIEAREEAGTPDIIGSIRCGLVFALKSHLATEADYSRPEAHLRKAWSRWSMLPNMILLGASPEEVHRVPIVSFQIKGLHMKFVNTLLSDLFGIQARDGCFCAHTYMADLIGMDAATQAAWSLRSKIYRPGAVRISLPWYLSDSVVDYIVGAVAWISERGWRFLPEYRFDLTTGQWTNRRHAREIKQLSLEAAFAARTVSASSDRFEAPPPDLTSVIERLEMHLAEGQGTPATAEFLSEKLEDDERLQRSFATPLEAAFLRDYATPSTAGGRTREYHLEADALVWTRFLSAMDARTGKVARRGLEVDDAKRTVLFEDLVESLPVSKAPLPLNKFAAGKPEPTLPKVKLAKVVKLKNFSFGKLVDKIPSFLH